jgi:hypothetical protein
VETGSKRDCSHGISITDQEERDIVSLSRTLGKILDGLKNRFLEAIQRNVLLAFECFMKAMKPEHFFFGVHGFGDAITKEDERVVRKEFRARHDVLSLGDEPNRERAFDEWLSNLTATKKQWQRMAGIDEIDTTLLVHDSEKHSCVAADFGMFAEKAINKVENTRGIISNSHPKKGPLEHGSEERRTETLAGNIRDQKGRTFVVHLKNVEVVAANGEAWGICPRHGEMRKIAEAER